MGTEIMTAFIKATQATKIETSADDQSLILDLQAAEQRNAAVRVVSAEVRRKAKREADMLQRARMASES